MPKYPDLTTKPRENGTVGTPEGGRDRLPARGYEWIRMFQAGKVCGQHVRAGERIEIERSAAESVVRSRHGRFSTRVELTVSGLTGLEGDDAVEHGIHAVVELRAETARRLIQEGKAVMAPCPLAIPQWPYKLGELVTIRFNVTGPTVPFINRVASEGEEIELPERIAQMFIDAKSASLVKS